VPNPTSQVQSRQLPFGGDDKFYLPAAQANDTFVNNEMIALNPATGLGMHCDDSTASIQFFGLFADPTRQVLANDPPPVLLPCRRPRLFTMPLASGTVNRGANPIGTPVYAKDSGHVQFGVTGLTNSIKVGYYFDVAGASPEVGTNCTSIWISAEPIN